MDYQQTIDYLYDTLPMFSRMGSAAYKKDLYNTRLLCEHLGNPQTKFKSIHVAGTNGKGSVSHMLAAVFQTAGYKTGLYTSPHLYDFRERIKINGEMAVKQFVVDFVEQHRTFMEEIQPSFFEITVAMAFEYFAQQQVDIAIIEVGLGGRLDSTNIITPELSIITNIGWDHMNLLGNSLEEIALEKAGIIKKDTPVVIGEKTPATSDVFSSVAAQKHATVYFAEDRFSVIDYRLETDRIGILVKDSQQHANTTYQLDLPGIYQAKNILAVLQAVELLANWNIRSSVVEALKEVKPLTGLHGRWEVIHHQPAVVLEVAHNQNGIEEMIRHIGLLQFNRLHLVVGMVKDKEVDQVLKLLPKDADYYFTQANIPRALDANSLQQKAGAYSLTGQVFADVNAALMEAIASSSKDDLVIVCGSIFLVAEVNRKLVTHQA